MAGDNSYDLLSNGRVIKEEGRGMCVFHYYYCGSSEIVPHRKCVNNTDRHVPIKQDCVHALNHI